ncbi:acyl-CoA dehydrogenase family protein [Polynucleobacter rarus]|jgi:alkylation response protein AidB-like acyl-CoA dehydrogenase|uniref:acyl-CoA dehydrogenase family protein n=1 Tax=Polynucleobacter rarus TaxID=556055 RepID=UPI000D3E2725|nr:acyl-CoA dehydrogenase family protein [Polynucleobacter rarus]
MELILEQPAEQLSGNAKRIEILEKVKSIAQKDLALVVDACDQEGFYPEAVLKALGSAGAFGAHLGLDQEEMDFGLAISCMEEVSRVCGATGFVVWCHDVCGVYMQASKNPALTGEALQKHAKGITLGGTGMSNPMKTFSGIETMMLKAKKVEGGYLVSGTLPWVSHIGLKHYFGTVCAVLNEQTGEVDPDHQIMFILPCDREGVTLKDCPSFSAMEGTSTYGLHLKDVLITTDDLVADPAKPFIKNIKASFILLQTGMGLGVAQGAIDSMWEVESQLGKVNQFLEDRPVALQHELDDLRNRIMVLAKTPYESSDEYVLKVLDVRAHASEIALRAAQSALLHQGARGYLLSSAVQRRVRESHFVAIVTPALKHLRYEMAKLKGQHFLN